MLIMKTKKTTPQARKNRIVIEDSDANIKAFRTAWAELGWNTEAAIGRAFIKAVGSGRLVFKNNESVTIHEESLS